MIRRLTGGAHVSTEWRNTDTVEVIESRNARSTVKTDVLAVGLTATRRSTELRHADRRQRRLHQILHQ